MSTTELGAELLPAGSQVGAWRVVSCAGQGMFGTVYRVRRAEPEDPRLFALKLARYPNDPRFEREVELLRRIEHPSGTYPPPHVQVEVAQREDDDTPKWVPPEQVATVSPKLAALIHQLLSVEPEARGSARQVAEAAERGARREGRRADAPITARAARKGSARPKWARDAGRVLIRASWLAAAAGAGMVLALWVRPHRAEEGSAGRQQAAQAGAPRRSAAGLAEAEEVQQASEPMQSAENGSISREMPKEPLPGQLRAPCKAEHEDNIRGGCWVLLGKKKPPCGKDSYEWRGGCYLASFPPERPATSGKP